MVEIKGVMQLLVVTLTYNASYIFILIRLPCAQSCFYITQLCFTLKSSNLPVSGFMSLFSEMEVDETKTQ